jgi:prepilin-type N-terminal cleavage/methylation domain-containing protein
MRIFLREKRNSNNSAFTLVEILVVIAVIGLLSSIIFAITRGADEQGRIAKGLYFSQHLQNSLGSYAAGIWSFDEGSGSTANDISGWNNNGSLVNSPTWRCVSTDTNYTPSGQGCSLEFNGSTQYVNLGNGTSLQPTTAITLEIWVKADNLSGNRRLLSNRYMPGFLGNYASWLNPKVVFVVNTVGTSLSMSSDSSVFVDRWTHIAMVYDGETGSVYINGNLDKEDTTPAGNIDARTGILYLGRREDGVELFSGLIDEVRIYSTALTAAQIRDQYYAGLQNLLARSQISGQEYQERLAMY